MLFYGFIPELVQGWKAAYSGVRIDVRMEHEGWVVGYQGKARYRRNALRSTVPIGAWLLRFLIVRDEEEPFRSADDSSEVDTLERRLSLVDRQEWPDVCRLGKRLRNSLEWRCAKALRRLIYSTIPTSTRVESNGSAGEQGHCTRGQGGTRVVSVKQSTVFLFSSVISNYWL